MASPSGVPVIFLHGITDSWRSFEGMLPHLPAGVDAYAVSLRGHGGSGLPAHGYRAADKLTPRGSINCCTRGSPRFMDMIPGKAASSIIMIRRARWYAYTSSALAVKQSGSDVWIWRPCCC